MTTQTKTQPRKVDPVQHASDFTAALLASYGFSSNFISARTGLTKSQVSYRLKRFDLKLRDYRQGESLGAQATIRNSQREIGRAMSEYLSQSFIKAQ